MLNLMQPAQYVSKPVTVQAMRWVPGDLLQAGVMVGWLMSNGVTFRHPSGQGDTTTLLVDEESEPLQPGGWVVRHTDGRFETLTDDEFLARYQLPALEDD